MKSHRNGHKLSIRSYSYSIRLLSHAYDLVMHSSVYTYQILNEYSATRFWSKKKKKMLSVVEISFVIYHSSFTAIYYLNARREEVKKADD